MSVLGEVAWIVYSCCPSGEQGDPRATMIGVGRTEEVAKEIMSSWAGLQDYEWNEKRERWEKRTWGVNVSVLYAERVPFIESHPLERLAEES